MNLDQSEILLFDKELNRIRGLAAEAFNVIFSKIPASAAKHRHRQKALWSYAAVQIILLYSCAVCIFTTKTDTDSMFSLKQLGEVS